MINLISKKPETALLQIGNAYLELCGLLTTPYSAYDIRNAIRLNVPFAMDNGCYSPGYNAAAISRHLHKWADYASKSLFAVVPDIVGNHSATLHLWRSWVNVYKRLSYPAAFVLQDGATVKNVPFNQADVLFIGGTNRFKSSDELLKICEVANERGLWIHAGRVGGKTRFRYSRDILKANSFDSSGFSMYPHKIHDGWIEEMRTKQKYLWE